MTARASVACSTPRRFVRTTNAPSRPSMRVTGAICAAVPEISGVQTHLEPLSEERAAREVEADGAAVVARVIEEETGKPPRQLRFEIEERIRRERPDIADVIVHTEP